MKKQNDTPRYGAPQVDPMHYEDLSYDTKTRFASYWHQIDLVVNARPERVLEVGIGSGFIHRYLRQMGLEVVTLDFDERLGPDVVGSVLELPFADGEFDVACCFETLEHLPWEKFDTAVAELSRVASRHVLLSLPDHSPCLRFDLEWKFTLALGQHIVDLPNLFPRKHEFDGQHYWEVGRKGWPLARVIKHIERHGLKVVETFRVFENPYHRFFRCERR